MKLSETVDPYLWLEEVEGEKALKWVEQQNQTTLAELEADKRFPIFEAEALAIYEAKDKIPGVTIRGDFVYNFWQDDEHIRGIWRRAPLDAYLKGQPQWEILLDIDDLSQAENENWVYKAANGLAPSYTRFLIELSRGGKDAVVVREYDIIQKAFVEEGFTVEESKSSVAWYDLDHVFVATEREGGSLTESGYPAVLRLWKRGEELSGSRALDRVGQEDLGIWGWTQHCPEANYHLISKAMDFWTHEISLVGKDLIPKPLDIPNDANFIGLWSGQIMMILRSAMGTIEGGALVAKDLETLKVSVVYQPNPASSISEVNLVSDALLVTVQEDVKDKVLRFDLIQDVWQSTLLELPSQGVISIQAASSMRPNFLYSYEDLLTPESLGYFATSSSAPSIIQSTPARFSSSELEVSQEFAISTDGTRVPYFLVKRKGLELDGNNPVLLYGYGGFEVSEKPYYRSVTGKLWLEKGGVFALANIRGGGEYGPRWHQAALKQNRHLSYEDFIAIAEDLIARGFTNPERLGIMGGSGGGLLVGAVFTLRPDLFGAMVSQVPLLDMLRYHKLLAGASWMGEYGDPDDPEMAAYLRKVSPYHSLDPQTTYARPLFTTSTKDDRVHPGHARKMVARMREQGHSVLYYENTEGGHAAGANLKQHAKRAALEFTYLHREIMD